MSDNKHCQHLHIAYLGEMSPAYTGPLFVCAECRQEWRLRDTQDALRRIGELVSLLKDIANEDNIWADPMVMAQETLIALGIVEVEQETK